jgi:ethanolamine permease
MPGNLPSLPASSQQGTDSLTEATPGAEIDYEDVEADYFAERQLGKGKAGWISLAALGIAYVISGEYALWNYGLAVGGWGGMIVALAIMSVMFFCLVFSLAELATIVPTAGGGFGFARRAFGPTLGFITGVGIVFQYTIGAAFLAIFFASYLKALTGIDEGVAAILLYGLCFAFHIIRAEESLTMTLVLAVIAALGVVIFLVTVAPAFSWHHLADMPVNKAAFGATSLFPKGWLGIWSALPFAMALFLGVEGIPFAAEDARDPRRDLPRGMIAAIICLFVASVLLLVIGPGGAGVSQLLASHDPLIATMQLAAPGDIWLQRLVNIAGLLAIAGGFFALIFAYSRQAYSLSRAGYLPRFLSVTNRFKSPYLAILIPGAAAFALTMSDAGNDVIVMGLGCATFCYIMMMASHIKLRLAEPDFPRQFSTPGGIATSGTALVLSLLSFAICINMSPLWTAFAAILLGAFFLYFRIYARHHIVAEAPEEATAIASL